jgi:1,2-dihydroxy-3-keto-5-methylthiopentene dioxygenase
MRLFHDEPKWTPLNRSPELDANPHRKAYLETLGQAAAGN